MQALSYVLKSVSPLVIDGTNSGKSGTILSNGLAKAIKRLRLFLH